FPHLQSSWSVHSDSVLAGQSVLSVSSEYNPAFPDIPVLHIPAPDPDTDHSVSQYQKAWFGRSHQRSVSGYCSGSSVCQDAEVESPMLPTLFPAGDKVPHIYFHSQTHDARECEASPHPCATPSPKYEHAHQTLLQTLH